MQTIDFKGSVMFDDSTPVDLDAAGVADTLQNRMELALRHVFPTSVAASAILVRDASVLFGGEAGKAPRPEAPGNTNPFTPVAHVETECEVSGAPVTFPQTQTAQE